MIILQSENRILIENAKYSYLVSNYASGVTSISIINASDGYAHDSYLLLGNIGSESAEIVQIDTVNTSTGVITLVAATKFSHSESTRVTIIQYNKIKFYHTVLETFGTGTLLADIDIQVSDWFTTWGDELYSTGFGWFVFYNSTSVPTLTSQPSNSLPYAGFDSNTVEDILNDFYSLLNNKELKLVTRRDALSWFNEGVSRMTNRLNRANTEYTASALATLTTTSGLYEYDLPSDFYQLISITAALDTSSPAVVGNFSKFQLDYIPLREAFSYVGSSPRYYIRGKKIGIIPTPDTTTTYHYMYLTKPPKLDSNSSSVDLPDNGFYVVKDFMMYRAQMKFTNPSAATYYKAFNDGLNEMVISAIDRDCNMDSFGVGECSNV